MENELVFSKGSDEVFTTSQIVAKELEVPHKNLLRTIGRILEKQGSPVSCVFSQKFIKTTLINKMNISFEGYSLNKPAFFKLIMQLGNYEKANIVQDKFIEAFFEMERALLNKQNTSWLNTRNISIEGRKEETDTIKDFIDYAIGQGSQSAKMYYPNITKMTYKALELLDNNKTTPIREYLEISDLWNLVLAEKKVIECLVYGMEQKMHYKEIYQYAKNELIKLFEMLPKKNKILN